MLLYATCEVFILSTLNMAYIDVHSVSRVNFIGVNENMLTEELRQEIEEKVLDYTRRLDVRATVVITERLTDIDPPEEDLLSVVICNDTYYVVLINHHFTLKMLLHDVRNDVISSMLS